MKRHTMGLIVALLAPVWAFAESAAPAASPEAVNPIAVGEKIPDVSVQNAKGEDVNLRALVAEKPTALIFYRGGWCPFCNKALAAWESRLDEVKGAGGKFIAISPEKPELARGTSKKSHLSYVVLSDSTNKAAEAFDVLFTVDAETRKKYEGYGIDLGEANASGEWKLPHPATFIIDRQGVVRYAHVDPDYAKGRADPGEVIDALKNLK